ncbi:hypothetical protein C8J57DRAFT_1296688 [Mycena rebaudengoi]|nr:hypothetical protein C8J57DRAFT_1296688 [Mycena rebaudengoi]
MEAFSQLDDIVSNVLHNAGKLHELVKLAQKAQEELDRVKQDQKTYLEELDRVNFENNRLARELETIELPHEILLIIFRYASAPSWLLNRNGYLEASHSILCSDLRMKIAIMGVCKNWHQIGIELLYKNVALRRIGQLPAFVRALEGRVGLGALVCRLNLSCFVPRGYSLLFQRETQKLISLCPRLEHIAFNPPFTVPTLAYVLPPIGSTITSLECSSAVDAFVVLDLLIRLCNTLRSLSFTPPESWDDNGPELVFENLEDLYVRIALPPLKWTMPRLRRLWSAGSCRSGQDVNGWFSAHGPALIFVSWRSKNGYIRDILTRCPALEHLVIEEHRVRAPFAPLWFTLAPPPASHWVYGPSPLAAASWKHDTLKSLDIWKEYSRFNVASFGIDDWKKVFPALCTYRILDDTFGYLVDLPMRAPPYAGQQRASGLSPSLPESIQDRDSMAIVREFIHPESVDGFPFGSIRDINGELEDDDEGNSSSGDEYVDDEEDDGGSVDSDDDSDSDSSGSCFTGSEGDLQDEFYIDEHWEVDRAKALDIFSGTLDSD